MEDTPLKYEAEVKPGGRIELDVPLAPGVHVTVFVVESENGHFEELLSASQSTLSFWNNSLDDEDWNNA
jgi:hypothetical protein